MAGIEDKKKYCTSSTYIMTNMSLITQDGIDRNRFYQWALLDWYDSGTYNNYTDINELIRRRLVRSDTSDDLRNPIISLHSMISEVAADELRPDSVKCEKLIVEFTCQSETLLTKEDQLRDNVKKWEHVDVSTLNIIDAIKEQKKIMIKGGKEYEDSSNELLSYIESNFYDLHWLSEQIMYISKRLHYDDSEILDNLRNLKLKMLKSLHHSAYLQIQTLEKNTEQELPYESGRYERKNEIIYNSEFSDVRLDSSKKLLDSTR